MHKSHNPGASAGGAGALPDALADTSGGALPGALADTSGGALPDALADTSGGARCLCAGFQLSERVRTLVLFYSPRAENRLGPGHIPGHRAAVVVSHMNEYSSTSPS